MQLIRILGSVIKESYFTNIDRTSEKYPATRKAIFRFLDKRLYNHLINQNSKDKPYTDETSICLVKDNDSYPDIYYWYLNDDIGLRTMFMDSIQDALPFSRNDLTIEIEDWTREIIKNKGNSDKVSDAIKMRDSQSLNEGSYRIHKTDSDYPRIKKMMFKFLDKKLFDHVFSDSIDDKDYKNIFIEKEDHGTDVLYYHGDNGEGVSVRRMFLDTIQDALPFYGNDITKLIEEWSKEIINNRTETNKVSDAIKNRDK